MPKASKAFKEHMEKRMHSFKKGQMHSRVKHTGPVVTKQSQAVAIALSEARKKGLKGVSRRKKMSGMSEHMMVDCAQGKRKMTMPMDKAMM